MDLFSHYGYVVVPKGTYLFRQGKIDVKQNTLFWSLHPSHTFCSSNIWTPIQAWKTKIDIKLLFMVKHLNYKAFVISAIEDIYYSYFDSPLSLNDLDIKGRNIDARNNLINCFKEDNVFGWFSSLENQYALEICLFPGQPISDIIELHSEDDNNGSFYKDYNALTLIEVKPSQSFITKSKKNISWPSEVIDSNSIEDYSLYQKLNFNTEAHKR